MECISDIFIVSVLLLVQTSYNAVGSPIVGGEMVLTTNDRPKYPFMVSLQDRIERDSKIEYQHFCGGSLISSQWILTAAHCAWRKELTKIFAVIGFIDISEAMDADRHAIQRMEFIYFQPNNFQNDIALVQLEQPYEFNEPHEYYEMFAHLPKVGMKTSRKHACKIIGYGATQNAGILQSRLMEAEVKVITKQHCQRILGHIWAPENGENTVCALGNKQDTCQGDSGGPLLCSYNGKDYVFGIVSHGLACGISGVPSIYTVTIPYVDWIELIVGN